jgi:hypothetical protein
MEWRSVVAGHRQWRKRVFEDGGPKRRNLSSTRSRHAIAKSLLEVGFACQAFGSNVLRSIINISF